MRNQLRELLLNYGPVSQIVGTRGYVKAPVSKADLPNFVVKVMDTEEHGSLDGGQGLRKMSIDIQCRAATAQESDELADVIRPYLRDYRGNAGTVNEVEVLQSIFNGEDDHIEKPTRSGDVRTFVTILDFDFYYSE